MDYRACELTASEEVPVRKPTMKDMVEVAEKTLIEANCVLDDTVRTIGGACGTNKADKKPECLLDEMQIIIDLARNCTDYARMLQEMLI